MSLKVYQPRNVLVTGGAGFIGANFVRDALRISWADKIVTLDLLTYASSSDALKDLPNENDHVFVQGDIRDQVCVSNLLKTHEIDTIVHFAAESHVDRSIAGPLVFIETNVLGTATLLEAARQYWLQEKKWDAKQCRFHHISTDEVYGSLKKEDAAFTEEHPYQPNSPYAASKAGSDHIVRAYHETYGLPITISNCSNNYGPYQHAEKFIPTVIQACLTQKPIPIYGDGSNIRDWLYVGDHVKALFEIITRSTVGASYNIGGNEEWPNLAMAEYICDVMDRLKPAQAPHRKLITRVTDRLGHDWRYAINPQKLERDLGWHPSETLQSGMEKTIEFYVSGI